VIVVFGTVPPTRWHRVTGSSLAAPRGTADDGARQGEEGCYYAAAAATPRTTGSHNALFAGRRWRGSRRCTSSHWFRINTGSAGNASGSAALLAARAAFSLAPLRLCLLWFCSFSLVLGFTVLGSVLVLHFRAGSPFILPNYGHALRFCRFGLVLVGSRAHGCSSMGGSPFCAFLHATHSGWVLL
jgi:hypothetical protein